MATNKAKPALASHAEKASKIIGPAENTVEAKISPQRHNEINRISIMASKQSKADKRCFR